MSAAHFHQLEKYLNSQVIGQKNVIRQVIIALIAQGHLLLEGPPGTAKTQLLQTLAAALDLPHGRMPFTADLMPCDLLGVEIYHPKKCQFEFHQGVIFHALLLIDEINRAPAKVQSALLEAMSEKCVTINGKTHPLPAPFFVMATQNPLDHIGTYPLPQAQLDRFLFKVQIDYPTPFHEKKILQKRTLSTPTKPLLSLEKLISAYKDSQNLYIAEELEQFCVHWAQHTRQHPYLDQGISTRALLQWISVSKVQAWLEGRDHVLPEDLLETLYPITRHRIASNHQTPPHIQTQDELIAHLLSEVVLV